MPLMNRDSQVPARVGTPGTSPQEKEACAQECELPLPPGLKEIPLTLEAAQRMRQLIDDPNQPGHAGKEMPTADASILLEKSQ